MNARQQAARWFLRLREAPDDADLRRGFEEWVATDPARAEEVAAFAATWDDFESPRQLERLANAVSEDAPRSVQRRRLLSAGALVFGVGIAAWLGWRSGIDKARPLLLLGIETGVAEIRREQTADGSRFIVGPRSRLTVSFFPDRREVMLDGGEAIFEVARDASRPFRVRFAHGDVLVIGTRFAVTTITDGARISVERGRVRVSDRHDRARILQPGDVAEVRSDGVTPRRDLLAADLLAWAQGSLVFTDAPLAEVVATLSRFRERPIRMASGVDAGIRLTAVIPLDQTDRFIGSLPKTARLRVEETAAATVLYQR